VSVLYQMQDSRTRQTEQDQNSVLTDRQLQDALRDTCQAKPMESHVSQLSAISDERMSPRFARQGLRLGTTESSDERSMYLASAFQTNGGICGLTKGVYSDGKRALGCQDSGNFALELGGCLPNE